MAYEAERRFRQQLSLHPGGCATRPAAFRRRPAAGGYKRAQACKIAQQEIDAGKIQFIVNSKVEEPAVVEAAKAEEGK
jgi:hypothetical protein